MTFDFDIERDRHTRDDVCTEVPVQSIEGIETAQVVQLRNMGRVSLKSPVEDRWYEIFDILFPGAQRPDSPCKLTEASSCSCY